MTPDNRKTASKTASALNVTKTVKTLIRVGKALREPVSDRKNAGVAQAAAGSSAPQSTPQSSSQSAAGLRGAARQAAETLRADPRVQDVGSRVSELRGRVGERADQRLAELIREKRARQGQAPPHEVSALLEQRRQERDARLAAARARQALLDQAQGPEQRRVLHLIALATPWAGGEARPVRYTQLLDTLAPRGDAPSEMAIHRALWTLAERRVLAVSPHGVITATRTLAQDQPALPGG